MIIGPYFSTVNKSADTFIENLTLRRFDMPSLFMYRRCGFSNETRLCGSGV